MKLLILSIIIVGFCVFALSITIIFKKDGKFPDKEISNNAHLRKKGLICAKAEEKILWSKKRRITKECDPNVCHSCNGGCN